MRTALIVGGAAVGLYILWRRGTLAPIIQAVAGSVPVADGNPSAAASMVAGAKDASQVGFAKVRGLINSVRPTAGSTFLAPMGGTGLVRTAGTLILSDLAPKPTPNVPTPQSGPTLGAGNPIGSAPSLIVNPSLSGMRTRGIVLQ